MALTRSVAAVPMAEVPSSRERPIAPTLTVLITAIALTVVAFAHNWMMVRDLDWPAVDTQYRELAAAQTILDEGYGPDSTYSREEVWYNPMAPLLIAGASRISGLPPRIVVARGGPIVNLLAPVALFVLMAALFDVYAALAGVAAFMFVTGSAFPFYYAATYSPWFAPENFGQAFFYIGMLAAGMLYGRPFSAIRSLVAGVVLGLTFLTHTAPALILGCTLVILAGWEVTTTGRWRSTVWTLAVALATAFTVSLPFSVHLLHYRFAVINTYPGLSPSDLLDLNGLPALALRLATIPIVAGAAVIVIYGFKAPTDRRVRLLLAWFATTLLFLAVHVAVQLAAKVGIAVPPIVPGFHFLFYLTALLSLAIGIGVRDGCVAAVDRLRPEGWRKRHVGADRRASLLVCLATCLLVAAYSPKYLARDDFNDLRATAVAMNGSMPSAAYTWIRSHTSPADVFLCTDDQSLYVVSPAGRKVVATNRYFSSPYVDWASRDKDRADMYARLGHRDAEGFQRLAQRYGVSYIVLPERAPSDFWLKVSGLYRRDIPSLHADDLLALPGFRVVFRDANVAIVAVDSRRS